MSKVYKVVLEFKGHTAFEIEAKDEESAEYKAVDRLHEEMSVDFVETVDAVVTLSDCQYTDQQELRDREERR